MATEINGVIFMFVISVLVAIPMGRYIGKVFAGDKTILDPIFGPIEKLVFRLSGINPNVEMTWKESLTALVIINMIWFVLGFLALLFQGSLPLNPDHNPSMTPDLAFNTAISFIVNCNLQDYSGETGASYFSQLFVFMFFQYVRFLFSEWALKKEERTTTKVYPKAYRSTNNSNNHKQPHNGKSENESSPCSVAPRGGAGNGPLCAELDRVKEN